MRRIWMFLSGWTMVRRLRWTGQQYDTPETRKRRGIWCIIAGAHWFSAVKGIDQSGAARASKLGSMSYEEWKAGKEQESVEYSAKSGIITGRIGNISTKIPVDKFTKYSLNQERQPDKAKAFESALGYTSKNIDALIANSQYSAEFERGRIC